MKMIDPLSGIPSTGNPGSSLPVAPTGVIAFLLMLLANGQQIPNFLSFFWDLAR